MIQIRELLPDNCRTYASSDAVGGALDGKAFGRFEDNRYGRPLVLTRLR
jgi:hypothetical protein